MLVRQRIILALLDELGSAVPLTALVKLAFLLSQETPTGRRGAFYDFVPYKYGPFSFTLYRELDRLEQGGLVSSEEERIGLSPEIRAQVSGVLGSLPTLLLSDVAEIVRRYGRLSRAQLLADVYSRYPWYATRSELTDIVPSRAAEVPRSRRAIYTIGYQGKSVDRVFDQLLKAGIQAVLDVRWNSVSRQYGFAHTSMSQIAQKLGIAYRRIPQLGIPSEQRKRLDGPAAYRQLLDFYESDMLPGRADDVREVAALMMQKPSVLLCFENDFNCCHRSRLAEAAAGICNLPIVHL